MTQNEGNWCCGACGEDSGIPIDQSPPLRWEVIECFDMFSPEETFEVLVCRNCNPKEWSKE
jgi:hypothetical protein